MAADGPWQFWQAMALERGTVELAALAQFVDEVASSGVFDGTELEDPQATDLGTTEVRFQATGPETSVSAYALDHPGSPARGQRP